MSIQLDRWNVGLDRSVSVFDFNSFGQVVLAFGIMLQIAYPRSIITLIVSLSFIVTLFAALTNAIVHL